MQGSRVDLGADGRGLAGEGEQALDSCNALTSQRFIPGPSESQVNQRAPYHAGSEPTTP